MSACCVAYPWKRSSFRPGKPFSHTSPSTTVRQICWSAVSEMGRRICESAVSAAFEPVERLLEVNRQNRDSWRPLFPVFDTEIGGFSEDNGFACLGSNAEGE